MAIIFAYVWESEGMDLDSLSKNGTAVVICPGGGLMALSIATEGTNVAKYLAAKGVTAFVLKYRLAHTGEDATQEFAAKIPIRALPEKRPGDPLH